MKKIAILLTNGVMDTSVALTLDTLRTANRLVEASHRRYEWTLFNPTARRVRTGAGAQFVVEREIDETCYDVLLIPGLGWATEAEIASRLTERATRSVIKWLAAKTASFELVGASCSAVFLLAETGFLDGRRATTTWWLAPFLRRRHPDIELDETAMVTMDENALCAGAATAQLDLMLTLLRHYSGPALAKSVGRFLAIDTRPSQARFISHRTLSSMDGDIVAIEHWLRTHLKERISLRTMSDAVAMSPRTLDRRVRQSLGISPIRFLQRLRVEHAVHLVETTAYSLERIANEVGYQDATTLRRLLKRELHQNPSELRMRGAANTFG